MIRFIACLLLTTMPLASSDDRLIAEGRNWGVQSIATGQLHLTLQQAAERHATYQASVHIQGHQGWEWRVAELRRQMPGCHTFKEVANESWPGQDMDAAAYEMFRSWRLSAGHWSAVNGRCRYYGYSMRRGSNGVWYACAIFAE